ncbi:unnamed protein product [Lampetra planeri]
MTLPAMAAVVGDDTGAVVVQAQTLLWQNALPPKSRTAVPFVSRANASPWQNRSHRSKTRFISHPWPFRAHGGSHARGSEFKARRMGEAVAVVVVGARGEGGGNCKGSVAPVNLQRPFGPKVMARP